MLIAVKGNKQVKIDEASRRQYLNLGYDIAEIRNGDLVITEHSPSKTVPYVQYERLLRENRRLRERLNAGISSEGTRNNGKRR